MFHSCKWRKRIAALLTKVYPWNHLIWCGLKTTKGKFLKNIVPIFVSEQVLSNENARIMNHYLEAVANEGTGAAIKTRYNIPGAFAGKTGNNPKLRRWLVYGIHTDTGDWLLGWWRRSFGTFQILGTRNREHIWHCQL